MTSIPDLDQLNPEQLRALAAQLLQRVSALDEQVETMGKTVQVMDKKIHNDKTLIEKLSHEIAQLKRFKFAKRSEQMSPEQASLLDDLIDTDIAAIEAELESLQVTPAPTQEKQKPKPSIKACSCSVLSSICEPWRVPGQANLPWWSRRAANQMPNPSCTRTFMRVARRLANR